MTEETIEMLRTLLVAQVLTLSKAIEVEKNTGNTSHSSSDHFVGDAIKEIARQRASILQRLAQTQ